MIAERWGLDMPPPGTPLLPGHPLRTGLVACWLYNHINASQVLDLSGNGYHATLNYSGAGLSWQAGLGVRGACLRSIVRLGTLGITVPLPALSTYSWDAWLVPLFSGDAYECLLAQSGALGFFLVGTPRQLTFYSLGDHLAASSVIPGRLVHLAATAGAGSGFVSFYKDGRPDGTSALTVPTMTFSSVTNDSASQTYAGDLLLQRVWNRVLSAEEVATLYG